MSSQSIVPSAAQLSRPLHIHIADEECPACGQVIPPEKLEEVKGKIASKDRERTLAITTDLESRFQKERAEQLADWQRSLDAAADARKKAEEGNIALQAKLTQIEGDTLVAVEAAKTQGKKEAEELAALEFAEASTKHSADRAALQEQLEKARAATEDAKAATQKAVDSAVAEKVAEADAKHNADQTVLQTRLEEAEAKVAATGEQSRLKQEASDAALAAANAAAAEASAKLTTLQEEQAATLTRTLEDQREVLDKAKENALNAQAAKHFDEHQKLTTKVGELTRALEKKTNEELGEGAELDLYEALRGEFPGDRITRVKKGVTGGDILHVIVTKGRDCGTIIYDSKNHKSWLTEHVAKLKTDQLAANAEYAILSTHKFPKGTSQLHIIDGVVVANPARVVLLAKLVRTHILRLHGLTLSSIERDSKTEALYKFITSDQCNLHFERMGNKAKKLLDLQEHEIKWHKIHWAKQGEAVRVIEKAKADLENEIGIILGTAADTYETDEALEA